MRSILGGPTHRPATLQWLCSLRRRRFNPVALLLNEGCGQPITCPSAQAPAPHPLVRRREQPAAVGAHGEITHRPDVLPPEVGPGLTPIQARGARATRRWLEEPGEHLSAN